MLRILSAPLIIRSYVYRLFALLFMMYIHIYTYTLHRTVNSGGERYSKTYTGP